MDVPSGCFSALMPSIKSSLALRMDEMIEAGPINTLTERRMNLLERAARASVPSITTQIIMHHELHAKEFVHAAKNLEDM